MLVKVTLIQSRRRLMSDTHFASTEFCTTQNFVQNTELGESMKSGLSQPLMWKTEAFMELLGWHPGSLFFVACYMYKMETGFVFMVRFLILKVKCLAASGIKWLLKHKRFSKALENPTLI